MTPLEKPVRRVTRGALAKFWGPDSGRRLVASLEAGDLLVLRPLGTRRPETMSLFDCYRIAAFARINAAQLEKARERKKELVIARARSRLRRSIRAAATAGGGE